MKLKRLRKYKQRIRKKLIKCKEEERTKANEMKKKKKEMLKYWEKEKNEWRKVKKKKIEIMPKSCHHGWEFVYCEFVIETYF